MPRKRTTKLDTKWDAENFRRAIDQSGRSLQWIAFNLDETPEHTVRRWYNGQHEPRVTVAASIARLLGVRLEALLP